MRKFLVRLFSVVFVLAALGYAMYTLVPGALAIAPARVFVADLNSGEFVTSATVVEFTTKLEPNQTLTVATGLLPAAICTDSTATMVPPFDETTFHHNERIQVTVTYFSCP